MSKPRVLIADDHKIFAEGLKRLLNEDFDIVGVVEDGRHLVAAAEKLLPDAVVVDISMPMLNGIDAVQQIKKEQPAIKVVFLTMHPDVAYAVRAFKEGASGYVLKMAIRHAMRIYLLAVVIGLETGVLAAGFHYCLEGVFHLHEKIALSFTGRHLNATLIAALMGALAGLRVIRAPRVIGVKFVGEVLAIGAAFSSVARGRPSLWGVPANRK